MDNILDQLLGQSNPQPPMDYPDTLAQRVDSVNWASPTTSVPQPIYQGGPVNPGELPLEQPKPPTPPPSPEDQIGASILQRIQQLNPAPPSGGPIKRLLQNFFQGGSEALSAHLRIPSPQMQQQQLMNQYIGLKNAQGLQQLRQAELNQYQMTDVPLADGTTVQMPMNSAKTVLAAQQRAQSGMVQLTPEQAAAIGHPEFQGQNVPKGILDYLTRTTTAQIGAASKSTMGKISPIIQAQVGAPPNPKDFPQGENDPQFQLKSKLWGANAEAIQKRLDWNKGAAYRQNTVGPYITPEGTVKAATGAQALAEGLTPFTAGFSTMSRQAQFSEMTSASSKLRTSITQLRPEDAFNATQTALLHLAMRAPDEGTLSTIVTNLGASGLNERQQEYVTWLTQMNERLLSLRNIAGMGQGAQDLRNAIQATLPNIASGQKSFALKKLDAVDQQIAMLYRGVPRMDTQNPGGGKVVKWGRDANGNPVRLP